MALQLYKLRHSVLTQAFPRLLAGLLFIYFYCEYLIYYVTQIQCGWPELSKVSRAQPVHVMILADPHLLGSRNGHWLDKWRREWQMFRAFQTAMTLHKPEIVFVLGDLFDEGDKSSDKEFDEVVQRFHQIFEVPEGTSLFAVAGNHDIGFHYRITPQLAQRFERRMRAPPVRLVSARGSNFVLLNSMALQGDGCSLCARALAGVEEVSDLLKCSSGSKLCKGKKKLQKYSRPILIQHFPLYRASDSVCTEPDAAPLPERNDLFVERWDCLSKESTEHLVESLRPRLAFGGHTHHSCVARHSFGPAPGHKIEFVEYTVPSFSWRNRLDPKYYLRPPSSALPDESVRRLSEAKPSISTSPAIAIAAELTVSPEEARVSKCEVPREWSMQVTAVLLLAAMLVYLRHYVAQRRRCGYKYLSGKKV